MRGKLQKQHFCSIDSLDTATSPARLCNMREADMQQQTN